MTDNSLTPDLPERLTQDLRALGGVQAPEELWERVQLGLALGEVEKAPVDLWDRVRPEVAAISAEQDSAKRPEPAGQVLHNQAWGRRLTAAAVLMILAGIGFQYLGQGAPQPGSELAGHISSADKQAFRAKVAFMKVSAAELSPVAKGFAQSLGGMTEEDA